MKAKVMNAMQSFSKALMGPVLFLPIAGMLQALSSVMCNTAFVSEGGISVSYTHLSNLAYFGIAFDCERETRSNTLMVWSSLT